MTAAYKSNIIRFKMDEDQHQRWIYFLTFIVSLDMISSQYRETREVLLDYPKTGGDDDIETISEKIAYSKHIRDLEFETREFFEPERQTIILKIL